MSWHDNRISCLSALSGRFKHRNFSFLFLLPDSLGLSPIPVPHNLTRCLFQKNQNRHCQKRNRGIDYPTTGDRRHFAGSRTDEKHVKTPGGLPMMALSQNVAGKDLEPEKPAFTTRK